MTSLEDMRRELREKYEKLRRGNPVQDRCWSCINRVVGLTEIPHMIYRTYPEMSDWYLWLLENQSEELWKNECITERTKEKLIKLGKRVKEAVEEGRRPYEETEALLSVLKSETVVDVAKVCTCRKPESSNPNGEKLKEDIDKFKREISAISCEELCKLVDELRITRNAIGIRDPLKHFLFTGYIHHGTMELKKRCRPEYQRLIERYREKYRKEIEEQEMLRRIGAL